MTHLIRCHCDQQVRFADEDRGFEVYCPSCGAAITVPALDTDTEHDAAARSTSSASIVPATIKIATKQQGRIFSDAGRETVARRFTHEMSCLCGRRIPYALEDIGTTMYCTCGTAIRVGEDLAATALGRVKIVDDDEREAPNARFKWVRSPWGAAVLSAVLVLISVGSYLMLGIVTDREDVVYASSTVNRTAASGGQLPPFDPTRLTIEMIEALADDDDFFGSLKQALAWERGLNESQIEGDDERLVALQSIIAQILSDHENPIVDQITRLAKVDDLDTAFTGLDQWGSVLRACGLQEDDARVVLLRQVGNQLIERADPITLPMIDELPAKPSAIDALQQAQLWQEALRDREAAEDDVRYARLNTVIATLRERLLPCVASRPWIDAFRGQVREIADALLADDLPRGRKAGDRCEALLREYPDDLAPLAARYLTLKHRLAEREREIEGLQRIKNLLAEAEAALADSNLDRLSAAVEARDMAKYLARITPMTTEDATALDQRVVALKPKFRLAQGRRAVRDAKACDRAGDVAARNQQVQMAQSVLPGLDEAVVRAELEKVRPWINELRKSPPANNAVGPTSQLGRDLLARDLYEACLEQFGNGNIEALSRACSTFIARPDGSGDAERIARLQESLFDAIELQITQRLDDRGAGSPSDPIENMRNARAALDLAVMWQDAPRWKALDGILRQRGQSDAEKAIARAVKLAEQSDFAGALETIVPALALGEAQSIERARLLHERWNQELLRRADDQLQAEQWTRIESRAARSAQPLELALDLKTFIERYPESEHVPQARSIRAGLNEAIDRTFAGVESTARKQMAAGQWVEAVEQTRMLAAAVDTDEQRSVVATLEQELQRAKTKFEQEFKQLGMRRLMVTVDDVLDVLRVAGTLSVLEPTHPEAPPLFSSARQRGAKIADTLLPTVRRYKSINPQKYRDELTRIYWLNADGAAGKEARRLLAEVGA